MLVVAVARRVEDLVHQHSRLRRRRMKKRRRRILELD